MNHQQQRPWLSKIASRFRVSCKTDRVRIITIIPRKGKIFGGGQLMFLRPYAVPKTKENPGHYLSMCKRLLAAIVFFQGHKPRSGHKYCPCQNGKKEFRTPPQESPNKISWSWKRHLDTFSPVIYSPYPTS